MKYDHEIIRDLMPLCIDGIASKNSQKAVEEHIAECDDCKSEWEQMKNFIKPCDNIPLPEDTAKYKATAKRVRKHHRWVLLKITCAVIAALFIIGIAGNFIDGARFTPESAAKAQIKEMSGDFYETPEEFHNAPEPEITIIGTVKSNDGKVADTYALIYKPDLDTTLFADSGSDRCDMMRMGLWMANGGAIGEYDENIGIHMSGTGHSCSYCDKNYSFVTFYVTDKHIKTISFVRGGSTYTVYPDEKGFCGISFEMRTDLKGDNIHEGTATDEKGNVLYSIQEVRKKTDNNHEYTVYDWVKSD